MNEMDLLTTLRDEVPLSPASGRTQELFYAGLRDPAAQRDTARRRRGLAGNRRGRPGWRPVAAAGLSLAIAAGVTAGVLLSGNRASPAGRPVNLTVQLLANRAAAAALAGPSVRPGQWVYQEATVINQNRLRTAAGWTTADGRKIAVFVHGRLQVDPSSDQPTISYRSLGSLPADPRALIARLGNTPPRGAQYRIGHAFETIAGMFDSYVMSPRLTAEIYRALGDFPGVKIDKHAVDVAGRHGVAFLLPGAQQTNQEILINPRTYQFMGYEYVGTDLNPRAPGAYGYAIIRQVLVSGPGVRP